MVVAVVEEKMPHRDGITVSIAVKYRGKGEEKCRFYFRRKVKSAFLGITLTHQFQCPFYY